MWPFSKPKPDLIDLDEYERRLYEQKGRGSEILEPVYPVPSLSPPFSWTEKDLFLMRENREEAEKIYQRVKKAANLDLEIIKGGIRRLAIRVGACAENDTLPADFVLMRIGEEFEKSKRENEWLKAQIAELESVQAILGRTIDSLSTRETYVDYKVGPVMMKPETILKNEDWAANERMMR